MKSQGGRKLSQIVKKEKDELHQKLEVMARAKFRTQAERKQVMQEFFEIVKK